MGTRIYLDNHATTAVDPRVAAAMLPWLSERPGNPSSPHLFGWEAAEAVEQAREQVARLLAVDPKGIVFTSGATESDNLAILGTARRQADRGRHLVTTTLEHPAVLDSMAQLEREGFSVTRVGVDASGVVEARAILDAVREDTILVSVMWANNEIGTVQPIAEIAAGCRERGVLFHSDAVQAIGRIPVDLGEKGPELLSITAHKFYGPKGIGALTLRRRRPRVRLAPLLYGGGQQEGLRPGTLPVHLIVGLGEACRLAHEELATEAPRIRALRDRLHARLAEGIEGCFLNGDAERRLPGNLSLGVRGVEAQAVLLELTGIGLSAGSACSSAENKPSAVLLAIGRTAEEAHCTLRFGVGRFNTPQDIDAAADAVIQAVARLRQGSAVRPPRERAAQEETP